MRRNLRKLSVVVLALALCVPGFAVAAAQDGAAAHDDDVAPGAGAPLAPRFVEEAAAAGIDHTYDGGWEYFTGGGVAVLDCDADGLPDLYFAGGAGPAALYRNESPLGGALHFRPAPQGATDLTGVTGAYPLDIDGDRRMDLVVLRRGENVLLRGLGDCAFERANERWGFDGGDDWSTAFSAKWDPGESLPTLAVGDYLTIAEAGATPGCDDSGVYRPASSDVYAAPDVMAPGYCALSMLFSDWDRSGHRDLRVTNDRQYYPPADGHDQLWHVDPGEPPAEYTQDDGWRPLNVFGMGIASTDLTGDGFPEYYITSMADNKLRTLQSGPGQPSYRDIGRQRGVNVAQPFAGGESLPSTAWHAEFDDVNNDGWVDLYVSKGNVEAMADHALLDPNNLLLGQSDGTFVEGAEDAGIVRFERTRGAAVTDLNLDGLLDLVEVNRTAPVTLWRNAGAGTGAQPRPMGDWLAIEPRQDGPNPDAVGAWIEVRAKGAVQTREVSLGGGHASAEQGPIHFGLGAADVPRVRVQWPDGEVGEWMPVAVNQRIRIERGTATPITLSSAAALTGRSPIQPAPDAVTSGDLPPVSSVDPASCVPTADRSKSVARLWDEVLLDAIRRDFPAPTVHARNLFHTSAAMWDAWAAYDPEAAGVFVDEDVQTRNVRSARNKAISYAAYRVLVHRYRHSVGGAESLHEFDELMAALCYPIARTGRHGDSAAALGNRIAEHIISVGLRDGSNERDGYASTDYAPVNEPMIVQLPGTSMQDPNRWQPLALKVSVTQNGQFQPDGPQQFVGPHWGHVTSFGLPDAGERGVPVDPGPPPLLGDPTTDRRFKDSAEQVIRYSSQLDPRDGFMVDISPRVLGGSTLGTNDGTGYEVNPVTGEPYQRNVVRRGDFGRVVAEFWADGPHSETPPGHWNTLANAVTDSPGFERRIGGVGPEVEPLEWDVKLYLALNGAVHDAAIAAWGAKGAYDYVRPISMIRWMGGLGQSSDPTLLSYDPEGLPLIPGEVEIITSQSSATGERHAGLADHVGEIAIRAWTGNPEDPSTGLGGVDWILAVEWVPYQLSTFVTPSFAGYVSGHSAFSRAAAEVLTRMTGSPFFPGGLGSWTIPAGSLKFEAGPTEDIELQWATYYDASDQAGLSRLYGGIHVEADDLNGRRMGARCGIDAWLEANRYFDGTIGA